MLLVQGRTDVSHLLAAGQQLLHQDHHWSTVSPGREAQLAEAEKMQEDPAPLRPPLPPRSTDHHWQQSGQEAAQLQDRLQGVHLQPQHNKWVEGRSLRTAENADKLRKTNDLSLLSSRSLS